MRASTITLEADDNFILHKIPYVMNISDDPIATGDQAKKLAINLIQNHYQFNESVSESAIIDKHKLILTGIDTFEPKLELKFFNDKEKLVNVQISFYCYPKDAKKLEQEFMQGILTSHAKK